MWAGFVEQLRKAGWRKVAIVTVAVVVVVVLAYGVNASNKRRQWSHAAEPPLEPNSLTPTSSGSHLLNA